jgi:hypothetical protein
MESAEIVLFNSMEQHSCWWYPLDSQEIRWILWDLKVHWSCSFTLQCCQYCVLCSIDDGTTGELDMYQSGYGLMKVLFQNLAGVTEEYSENLHQGNHCPGQYSNRALP